MKLFHRKSPLERALEPAVRLARKSGKPILVVVGAAVATTALSAATSVRRGTA